MNSLSEKSCPKCGAKTPVNVRFCKICGALMEERSIDRFIRENVTPRLSVINRPVVLCLAISIILFWAGVFLRHQELIRWAWIGMIGVPCLIMIGVVGIRVLLHPRTFHTRKEYVAFSALLIGLPIGLLIYTVLVFRGVLPFPRIK